MNGFFDLKTAKLLPYIIYSGFDVKTKEKDTPQSRI